MNGKTCKIIGRWVLAALFIVGGVGHLVATPYFMKMMPPYVPMHRLAVLLSGVVEIALGVLRLTPRFSRIAAWGIVALLIAVFPANVHVYQHPDLFPVPPILLLLRLPLQGVLILWAYAYTRPSVAPEPGA